YLKLPKIAFQELIDKGGHCAVGWTRLRKTQFLIRLITAFGPNLEELGSSK
ncbi:hypothetical protein ACJX0J_014790, partial [Zea mays]